MKMKFFGIVFFISGVFTLAGCDKQRMKTEEGTYTGTFTVTYENGVKSGTTTLKLKDGKFSCQGNPDRIPAGGSGTYQIKGNTVEFTDINFWTADFDWNLILNGNYEYSFDGKKMVIKAFKNDVGHYEYDLERQ